MRNLTSDEQKSLHRALRESVKMVHKAEPEKDAARIVKRIFSGLTKKPK